MFAVEIPLEFVELTQTQREIPCIARDFLTTTSVWLLSAHLFLDQWACSLGRFGSESTPAWSESFIEFGAVVIEIRTSSSVREFLLKIWELNSRPQLKFQAFFKLLSNWTTHALLQVSVDSGQVPFGNRWSTVIFEFWIWSWWFLFGFFFEVGGFLLFGLRIVGSTPSLELNDG